MSVVSGVPDTRAGAFGDPLRQRGRTFLLAVVWVTGVGAAVTGVVLTVIAGGLGGAGLSFLYALIPVPVLLGVYLWLDAYEPEPRRYLAATFVWGAVAAVLIALAVQLPVQQIWDPSLQVSATYIAPMSEEPAKGLVLVLTLLRRRRVIDGMVDGFVYAGVAGLGFAFTENVLYYTTAYATADEIDMPGALGATGTFFARGLMTPFLHPVFTSCFGVGFAMAVLARRRLAKVVLPLVGIAAGMTVHGGWNAAASSQEPLWLLLAYAGVLAVLGGLITWALIARRNEGRMLWSALADMARRRGWLHVDEVPYLARLGLRTRARTYARRVAGEGSADAVRTYQRLATSVAFLYDGVMRGRPRYRAVERVDAMRDAMTSLRPQIVLPPPVRIVKRLPRAARSPAWGYPPPGGHHPPPPGWQAPTQQGPVFPRHPPPGGYH